MLASFIPRPGTFELREVPKPSLSQDGQVLIRTELACICGSDLHEIADPRIPADVRPPGYPCHESVGVVEETMDDRFPVGQRVLAVQNLTYAAGFAPYQVIPTEFVVPLTDSISNEEAVFAQQLGTTIFAMKRFWPENVGRAGTAVVLGAGSAGLSFTNLCRLAGFEQIIVSDLYPHRLEAAREMGATQTVLGGTDEIIDVVREATGGLGADLVIEAAGQNESRLQTFQTVRTEGRIGFFGVPSTDEWTIPFAEVFRRKPSIEMRWDAQAELGLTSFRAALDLIETGRIDAKKYRMQFYTLEQVPEVLDLAANPTNGLIKAGVRFA